MIKLLYLILFLGVIAATGNLKSQDNQTGENKTDKVEWEMKQYYMVFLNAAPNPPKMDSVKVIELQMAHLANIEKMFNEGKCRLAGPFMEKGEMRGILILDVASKEEAEKLCNEDPFIQNGFLAAVIKPWYGPAGLYVQPKAK